jgi:hypothetical protein
MSRERFIYGKGGIEAHYVDDSLIWLRPDLNTGNKVSDLPSPMICRDIEPYKSMITGEMITSRSVHKAHLRQHNCVEVGNDTSHMKPKAPKHDFKDRKKVLSSQLADFSDRQVKTLIKNEIKQRKH